ncbi:hypothetical protein PIIN_09847 [Serendipita indica DSM 11827]|uniref:Uncharacterized protein n=1 Tax=Serendipita indica (strain DSM 11827) TaxID=1109443 RepID=G4TX09_SERID|nr:hypothetical protein PIIN_09847 [Serendipita indica DSM 11827]
MCVSGATEEIHIDYSQDMSVSYTHNKTLIFAGTSDPCFQVRLISIGLTEEKCPSVSAALAEVLKEKAGLDSSRGYMQLTDPTAARTGFLAYPPRFLDFSTDVERRVKLAHPSLNNSGFHRYLSTLLLTKEAATQPLAFLSPDPLARHIHLIGSIDERLDISSNFVEFCYMRQILTTIYALSLWIVLTLPRQHPPARTRSVWLRSLLTSDLFFPVKLSNLPPQGTACIPCEHFNVVSHEPLSSVSPVRGVYVTRYPLNLHASVVSRRDVAPLSILTPMHLSTSSSRSRERGLKARAHSLSAPHNLRLRAVSFWILMRQLLLFVISVSDEISYFIHTPPPCSPRASKGSHASCVYNVYSAINR